MPFKRAFIEITVLEIFPGDRGNPQHRTWPTPLEEKTESFVLISVLAAVIGSIIGQTSPALTTPTLKSLSIEELLNVEVTSVSGRPERLFETASAIQVITQSDIRRSGATSIPEALRLASNLEVAQIDARQWAISSRGFNSTTSNKLLVLIDGRTVYTPLYAGVFWAVQDVFLEDIDRIEVISGPGATVWGANAVNGVINIITKKAESTQGILVEGGGGAELRGFGGVRYGGRLGNNLNFRFYGKYFDRDSSSLTTGLPAHDDWHAGQIGFRAELKTSAVDVLTLQADVYDGRALQRTAPEIGLGGGNVIARWQRALSESSDVKFQFYYDRTNRRIPESFAEGLDTFDADLQHRFPLAARHDVVWGIAYRLIEDDTVSSPGLAFFPAHVSRQWFSGFVQDEIAFVKDRLHATFGSKLEHNDYTGFELQPTARLVWKAGREHSLWGAISRAVRVPSRIDREFFSPRNPPFVLSGNSNFVSENLRAYELGYKTKLRNRISFSAASYYNDYDNVRSLERLRASQLAPFPAVIGNGLEAKSYGTELIGEVQLTEGVRIRAGYSPFQIDFSHKPGSTDPGGGSVEARDSDHHFLLRPSVDLPAHVQFDSTFRYVSSIAVQAVPGYVELDSRLAWSAGTKMEISVVGKNLLHPQHPEFGTAPSRRQIERSGFIKVAWSF